jgi:hypothetical protein
MLVQSYGNAEKKYDYKFTVQFFTMSFALPFCNAFLAAGLEYVQMLFSIEKAINSMIIYD